MPPALVLGSDLEVAEVGRALLSRGNAVDSVAGAVFAAGALYPSVLLGPVQLLLGGAGAGLRAIDGRPRQPGLGNPRPRGFLPSEAVPPAARVGVPALPAALLAAVTTYGRLSVAAVLAPAVELARAKSKPRAMFLERVSQRGPAALAEAVIADELVALAGRLSGGLLSKRDLDELRPVVATAVFHRSGAREVACVPWGAAAVRDPEGTGVAASDARIVVAVDRNGLVAMASYAVPRDGLALEVFDLVAPFSATPVLRSKARVKPGELRSAPAPMALGRSAGVLDLAVGLGATADGEAALGRWLSDYEPASELLRDVALPPGLVGAQRAGAGWAELVNPVPLETG